MKKYFGIRGLKLRQMAVAGVLVCLLGIPGCQKKQELSQLVSGGADETEQNLSAEEQEKIEAEEDCRKISESVAPILEDKEKGAAINTVITDETAEKMLHRLESSGCTAYFSKSAGGMRNYKKMDKFLSQSLQGKAGEILVYELCADGGIGRNKFIFNGRELTVSYTRSIWSDSGRLVIQETECYRIKEWKYTEKGWFSYELSVPEPPEVSERINGIRMVRVKPQKEEYLKIASEYLLPLGYQKNNLLCSNWDAEHLEDLDYMGLYECLYIIKNKETCNVRQSSGSIPGKEFENLIAEYLPVTSEQLRKYAEFDAEKQIYTWNRLGCLNYTPTAFGTSIPEITDIKENTDGTTAITVDAVCRRIGNDCVMSHILTVRFTGEDGVQYLGNHILENGLENIPSYQYRK